MRPNIVSITYDLDYAAGNVLCQPNRHTCIKNLLEAKYRDATLIYLKMRLESYHDGLIDKNILTKAVT